MILALILRYKVKIFLSCQIKIFFCLFLQKATAIQQFVVLTSLGGNFKQMLLNKITIIALYNYYYVLVYSNGSVSNIFYLKTKK